MKYHIITFGCQMNISDSERISTALNNSKYKLISNINEADLIVVNMCSVRQSAVDRVHGLRQKFEKLKKGKPNLKTILTGCILKKDKKIFKNVFDYVVDIKDINKLPQILKTNTEHPVQKIRDSVISEPTRNNYLDITPNYSNKFSANVPIMTGCNNFCSYCVVPHTREREVSRPAEKITCEIKNLIKNGCKEIWLLGQNVNSYKGKGVACDYDRSHKVGKSFLSFAKLLKMVNDIPGDFWIRFTSSHPKDFTEEVIDAMTKCKKVTPYLNLPIQSGDNKVLKSMNRHYTAAQYKNIIKKLRKAMPNISLSTDIIVGFPGETKKQFENTVKLFKDIKFDMAYVNKYSPRAGTAAAKLKDDVSPAEKKRREKVLTEILKQTALEKNKKSVGKILRVLIDSQKDNTYLGKSEGYKTIKIQKSKSLPAQAGKNSLIGNFVTVEITKAQEWALEGILA